MKISILIPTLNRLTYFKECLDSARTQTHSEIEILVSDDGSKDGTQSYVREIEAVDNRVRLLPPNPTPGLFQNFWHLIQHASGDAFCILGDDDRLLPDYIAKLRAPLVGRPEVIASFCDHWIIDSTGRRLPEATDINSRNYLRFELPEGVLADPLVKAMSGCMCLGFSLYRSSVFKSQPFDSQCGGAADFDYAIRAAKLGKIWFVPERLGEYRSHTQSATAIGGNYMLDGIIVVFRKHRFSEPGPEKVRRGLLRQRLLVKALVASTLNPSECRSLVREFLSLGGNPANSRLLLSLLLSVLPTRSANRLKSKLINLRDHLKN